MGIDDRGPKTPPTSIWVGDEWQRQLRKLRTERSELLETLRNLVHEIEQMRATSILVSDAFLAAKREIDRTR
jgi:hypothetical protein